MLFIFLTPRGLGSSTRPLIARRRRSKSCLGARCLSDTMSRSALGEVVRLYILLFGNHTHFFTPGKLFLPLSLNFFPGPSTLLFVFGYAGFNRWQKFLI